MTEHRRLVRQGRKLAHKVNDSSAEGFGTGPLPGRIDNYAIDWRARLELNQTRWHAQTRDT